MLDYPTGRRNSKDAVYSDNPKYGRTWATAAEITDADKLQFREWVEDVWLQGSGHAPKLLLFIVAVLGASLLWAAKLCIESSSKPKERPPGRAPFGKIWDSSRSQWVPETEGLVWPIAQQERLQPKPPDTTAPATLL